MKEDFRINMPTAGEGTTGMVARYWDERVIILSLQGGLGNQLFEWAFALALMNAGHSVLFDRARLRGDRPYVLGDLVAREHLLPRPLGIALAASVKLGLVNDRSKLRYVKQRRSGYDDSVLKRLDRRTYLQGYFQSTRYFDDVATGVKQQIREHLDAMLTPAGRDFSDELRADKTSVAVHVRRGDYLSDAAATAKHGVLDRKYYDQSLALMEERGFTRRVWFSDDTDWVRENLARAGDTVCPPSASGGDGGEIALMASCRARITANSSFSWWGGWLGDPSTSANPVIAPQIWFAAGHSDASDLVPSTWIRL